VVSQNVDGHCSTNIKSNPTYKRRQMEKIKQKNFRLAGLKLENKTTNENGLASIDCGNLWQRFESEKFFERIPNKLTNEIYAVYYDYEKDETAPYSYFIGCKIDETTEIPNDLLELIIPSQNYKKIIVNGVMTGCVIDAWKKIWTKKMDRQFGFDFEVYGERSQDWNNAELDIFISVNE
jgi:predicted transcriptional regulator YdeE